jgi:AcrR family transcriptional regulator
VPGRLIEVATRLFAERGFESTSVQSIVDEAGVTKGALYHHFGSKDELLYEIYAGVLRIQTAHLEHFAAAEGPIADRVHAAAADVVETTIASLDEATIFFRSMHQLAPEQRAKVRAERRRYHDRFCRMIKQGQQDGIFRDDVPADLVVDYHFGAVHHLGIWYRRHGELHGREIGTYFADLLLAGLRPE